MRTWSPELDQSVADRVGLAEKLDKAVQSLARYTAGERKSEVESVFDELRSSECRNAPRSVHPDVFLWYFDYADAARVQDRAEREIKVTQQIDRLCVVRDGVLGSFARASDNLSTIGAEVDFDVAGDFVQVSLSRGQEVASKLNGRPVSLRTVEAVTPALLATAKDAFALIGALWPEAHAEIQDFARRIVFFNGEFALGYTDFRYHGSLFLRTDHVSDAVEMAEEVLHEAAHIRLNNIFAISPIIMNDSKETYSSPLRKDPRPMFGVFHQMFVLARLAEMYKRLNERQPGNHLETFRVVVDNLNAAREVVNLHGVLTEVGQEIVTSVNDLADRLSAHPALKAN